MTNNISKASSGKIDQFLIEIDNEIRSQVNVIKKINEYYCATTVDLNKRIKSHVFKVIDYSLSKGIELRWYWGTPTWRENDRALYFISDEAICKLAGKIDNIYKIITGKNQQLEIDIIKDVPILNFRGKFDERIKKIEFFLKTVEDLFSEFERKNSSLSVDKEYIDNKKKFQHRCWEIRQKIIDIEQDLNKIKSDPISYEGESRRLTVCVKESEEIEKQLILIKPFERKDKTFSGSLESFDPIYSAIVKDQKIKNIYDVGDFSSSPRGRMIPVIPHVQKQLEKTDREFRKSVQIMNANWLSIPLNNQLDDCRRLISFIVNEKETLKLDLFFDRYGSSIYTMISHQLFPFFLQNENFENFITLMNKIPVSLKIRIKIHLQEQLKECNEIFDKCINEIKILSYNELDQIYKSKYKSSLDEVTKAQYPGFVLDPKYDHPELIQFERQLANTINSVDMLDLINKITAILDSKLITCSIDSKQSKDLSTKVTTAFQLWLNESTPFNFNTSKEKLTDFVNSIADRLISQIVQAPTKGEVEKYISKSKAILITCKSGDFEDKLNLLTSGIFEKLTFTNQEVGDIVKKFEELKGTLQADIINLQKITDEAGSKVKRKRDDDFDLTFAYLEKRWDIFNKKETKLDISSEKKYKFLDTADLDFFEKSDNQLLKLLSNRIVGWKRDISDLKINKNPVILSDYVIEYSSYYEKMKELNDSNKEPGRSYPFNTKIDDQFMIIEKSIVETIKCNLDDIKGGLKNANSNDPIENQLLCEEFEALDKTVQKDIRGPFGKIKNEKDYGRLSLQIKQLKK